MFLDKIISYILVDWFNFSDSLGERLATSMELPFFPPMLYGEGSRFEPRLPWSEGKFDGKKRSVDETFSSVYKRLPNVVFHWGMEMEIISLVFGLAKRALVFHFYGLFCKSKLLSIF